MGAEWVAPVVTGVVGIVGVTGTYLTGRLGRDAAATQAREQREHSLQERARAEKSEVYVAFLDALTEGRRVAVSMTALGQGAETRMQRREMLVAASSALLAQRNRLRLVASQRVRELARLSHQNLGRVLHAGYSGAEAVFFNVDLDAALLASMKEDLSHELAPADLEALDWQPPPPAIESEPDEVTADIGGADPPRTEESS